MRKTIIAAAVSAALVGGMFAGAVVSEPAIADAQEEAVGPVAAYEPGSRISEILDGLVADGTLTTAQAEAVAEALADARPELGFKHQRGLRGPLSGLSEILGIDGTEIREALTGGSTVAELAAEVGIPVDDVIAELTAAVEERLDDAVAAGRIDEATAEERLADMSGRISDLVNGDIDFNDRPMRDHRGLRGGLSSAPGFDA